MFQDIFGHREVDVSFVAILFQVDTAVEVADAILNDLVYFLTEGVVEVLEIVFADIFDTEVINGKVKPGGLGFVLPEAGSMGLLVVAVAGESFLEEFVGKKFLTKLHVTFNDTSS